MQETSPLPDAGSELAITPAERLAPARPSVMTCKWTAAIIASCLFHAAVAAAFLIAPAGTFDSSNAIQAEGTDRSGDNVAGSGLDRDQTAMNVTLVPAPQPTKPEPAKAARPAPPSKPSQPAREATKQPLKPLPEAVKQPAATPDILVASAPRPDDQSVIPKTEAPAQPTVQAERPEAPAAVPDQAPIPSARPSLVAAPVSATEADEKRGAADGQDRLAQVASKGKKLKEAGDAAETRYTGEVQKKLARANRRVSKSAQTKARGNALVAFVVMADGSISDLQLAESSGSAELDQFALTLVRQQAPFPPIPPETGNSSWLFKARIGPF
jgi:protein TonB